MAVEPDERNPFAPESMEKLGLDPAWDDDCEAYASYCDACVEDEAALEDFVDINPATAETITTQVEADPAGATDTDRKVAYKARMMLPHLRRLEMRVTRAPVRLGSARRVRRRERSRESRRIRASRSRARSPGREPDEPHHPVARATGRRGVDDRRERA
jgi:hypothetical protein